MKCASLEFWALVWIHKFGTIEMRLSSYCGTPRHRCVREITALSHVSVGERRRLQLSVLIFPILYFSNIATSGHQQVFNILNQNSQTQFKQTEITHFVPKKVLQLFLSKLLKIIYENDCKKVEKLETWKKKNICNWIRLRFWKKGGDPRIYEELQSMSVRHELRKSPQSTYKHLSDQVGLLRAVSAPFFIFFYLSILFLFFHWKLKMTENESWSDECQSWTSPLLHFHSHFLSHFQSHWFQPVHSALTLFQ